MQQTTHDGLILWTGLASLRTAGETCVKLKGAANIGFVLKVQIMRSHSVCGSCGMLLKGCGAGLEYSNPIGRHHKPHRRAIA